MNILKSVLASTLLASVTLAGNIQADNSLSSLIYEESSNVYSDVTLQDSMQIGIVSYSDDANKNSVWSSEFEQYVNPADFKPTEIASVGDVNQYVGGNPTAAGKNKADVFIYNETAGEFHLQ